MKKLIVTLCMLFVVVMAGGVKGYVGGADYYTLSNGKTVPACHIINYMGHTDLNYHSFVD